MATDFKVQRQRLRGLCLAASDLIDELEKMHPAKTPSMDTTERQLWADIGSRKVVEFLAQLRDEARADAGPIGRVLGAQ